MPCYIVGNKLNSLKYERIGSGMKRILIICTLLSISLSALFAQAFEYGNAWYKSNPDRPFVKLVVDADGIYRISAFELTAAGFDMTGVDATFLQLYYRGKEVPMYVNENPQGGLNYLDFVGRRNDGYMDSMMYRDAASGLHDPDLQPNRNMSLFADESSYFLTWSNVPGRRFQTLFDPLYTLYTPESSFRYEALREFMPGDPLTEYALGGGGQFDSFYTLNSDYGPGEGYVGPKFQYLSPYTLNIDTPFPANVTGGTVDVRTRVFGRSNTQHQFRLVLNNSEVFDTTLSSGVYIRSFQRDQVQSLTGNSTDLTFEALRANTDNNNICWASLTYDRQFELGGDSSIIIQDWNRNTPAYFRFQNAAGKDTVWAYDLNNPVRAVGLMNGNTAQVIVPGLPGSRDILLVTDNGLRKPKIEAAAFNKLFAPGNGAEYIIIANRTMRVSAEAYANYRDTATTNPVSVKLVYTDEIYDEYGYGSLTPWAIKRFCKDAIDNWNVKPQYVLLWGKGAYRTRGAPVSLVPTFGYPATDFEFVGHFDPNSIRVAPEIAIGRVNIYTDQQGMDYLEKVNEYEHTPWKPWMKKGVFLGGGGNVAEQTAIGGSFSYNTNVFSSAPYGGNAVYFQKTSTSTIEEQTAATYHEDINAGVALIHFFGHSTSNILDISIREPVGYNNFGRYPLMIAMGCYGGDFTGGQSFGERWVTWKNRGAIGYMANSSAGYLTPLKDYGRIFYGYMFRQDLGQPLGKIVQKTVGTLTDSLVGVQYRNHARQMNLQGDPAVALYHPEKVDLEIKQSSIFFTPENFSAQDDSFLVNVIVNNLGLATADSFDMTIRQRLPNNEWFDHPTTRHLMVPFIDTLSLMLYKPEDIQVRGQNTFEVFVDAANEFDEYDESNNQIRLDRIIPGNIPAILSPSEYAIVGANKVRLDASTYFMTNETNVRYVFEIDSTAEFDSPLLTSSGPINGTAPLGSWEVPLTLQDSTVYFWRVRLADVQPSVWGNSSFKYIANRKGWAQSDLNQFTKDATQTVSLDLLQNEWKFAPFSIQMEFTTQRSGVFRWSQNGSLIFDAGLNGFSVDGVIISVVDPVTLIAKAYSQYGPTAVAKIPSEYNRIKSTIQNAQPGDYVIVASNRNPQVQNWPDDIFDALNTIGVSDNIKLLDDGDPFMILGRKGYPNSAVEVYAPNVPGSNLLQISQLLSSSFDEGKITSTLVGPGVEWDQLFWGWETQDQFIHESVDIDVYGIRVDDTDTLLYAINTTATQDISQIDAEVFPYLRLEAGLVDTIKRTAPQLDNWHVLFTPAPDAVVDPITNFVFESDTLFEGEDVFLRMGANNISEFGMDSLLVKLSLEREDRSVVFLDTIRTAVLPAGGRVEFEYTFNTKAYSLDGNVSLVVEINAYEDQPEIHRFNNLYVQSFYVIVDRINPILDVTIDGKHIMNGDIVSPNPEILIEVNDENPFTAVTDSAAFELYFKKGTNAATNYERLFIASDSRIDWTPAELPENKARLVFYPGREQRLEDGEYSLRVQGRDQKGNTSGSGENFYEITFEVITESALSQVLNYPNPFSTSTRFVYTLTGEEMPDVFQIQIYTISGKQVKVIDLKALGDVNIGRNITSYAWDGTDEFGDRLANGVYLYRVVTKSPGDPMKLRDEGISDYFNNGWGKMYLMR